MLAISCEQKTSMKVTPTQRKQNKHETHFTYARPTQNKNNSSLMPFCKKQVKIHHATNSLKNCPLRYINARYVRSRWFKPQI